MGLVNWLKKKIFHKREEEERGGEKVSPTPIVISKSEEEEAPLIRKEEGVGEESSSSKKAAKEVEEEPFEGAPPSRESSTEEPAEMSRSAPEEAVEDDRETPQVGEEEGTSKRPIQSPEEPRGSSKEPRGGQNAREASSAPTAAPLEKPLAVEEPKEERNEEVVGEVDGETKIYNLGLKKSRDGFAARLNGLAKKYKEANSDYFDELERCLIEADVGVSLTMSALDETEKTAATQHISDPKEINDLLVDNLFMSYAKSGASFQTELKFDPENPTVLLVVGVNGTGKTTTIAKLAKRYKRQGKKVLLVAADTFRAGAVEQLSIWAKRVGVDIYQRGQGADPASVCYDAVKKAVEERYDLVIVDTAGRLHTKDYLMAELGKIDRVIRKVLPVAPQEIWLALDANTGQNGVQQAKVFKEMTPLTGVIITKMDGTSKGGIILAIRDQIGVPVRFIGLGEKEDDLREFDLDRYLYALLVGEDSLEG